jgi:hypothetical protein
MNALFRVRKEYSDSFQKNVVINIFRGTKDLLFKLHLNILPVNFLELG